MDFIGREEELRILQKQYDTISSSFTVLYGRRRVGKTTLIKKFEEDKLCFHFLATQEMESQNMKRFAAEISKVTRNPLVSKVVFESWVELFRLVADYKPGVKKILTIDEFPYLVGVNPAMPSILQAAWDEFLKDSNIMLILSGSLVHMMKKHVLSEESPLYGRRTCQINLKPLSFPELYNAFHIPFADAVERYSVSGGVPKYVESFLGNSLMDDIDNHVLSSSSYLFEEPAFLLGDEVGSPAAYFTIMKVVSEQNHKLSEISGALRSESKELTPYIRTLMQLWLLEKKIPISDNNESKSRMGLYYISDCFMRFWFRYVYPYRSELEAGNHTPALEAIKKDFIMSHVPFVFEDVSRDIFRNLCIKAEIDFTPSKIGSFWQNGKTPIEIDIAAVDHENKRLFLGECKYRKQAVGRDVLEDLREKYHSSSVLKSAFPGYAVTYGLFSKSGYKSEFATQGNSDFVLINEDKRVL